MKQLPTLQEQADKLRAMLARCGFEPIGNALDLKSDDMHKMTVAVNTVTGMRSPVWVLIKFNVTSARVLTRRSPSDDWVRVAGNYFRDIAYAEYEGVDTVKIGAYRFKATKQAVTA